MGPAPAQVRAAMPIPTQPAATATHPPSGSTPPPGPTASWARLSGSTRSPVSAYTAQTILAEIGLDMSRFPTPEHLVSWARLCPRTIQSRPVTRAGKTGNGNPYLKGTRGETAAAAAKTNTFLLT
jgi:transposase